MALTPAGREDDPGEEGEPSEPAGPHRQATVQDWQSGVGGTALLDDGSHMALPPTCLLGSDFRLLRTGQRVRLSTREGVVVRVHLP